MSATPEAVTLAQSAAYAASEALGTNIVALDVSSQLVITDIFVVASAPSERQVLSIVDRVEEHLLKKHGAKPLRREGKSGGRWVLLDYADIVVHVFIDEDREFYALERLWKDCPVVDVSQAVAAAENHAEEDGAAGSAAVSPTEAN